MDKTAGLRFDQTIVMTGLKAQNDYPDPLRRIGYRDPITHRAMVFLSNSFTVPALSIAQLYRGRWQIELFSKWIKQHLRSKAFGASGPCAALSLRVQLLAEISIERKNRLNGDDLANVGGLKIKRARAIFKRARAISVSKRTSSSVSVLGARSR